VKVICVAHHAFVAGSRRRLGQEFDIAEIDYIDFNGELRLPACLVPASDRARANEIIAELKGKGEAAARASAGKAAKIQATAGRTA
jgi:hypothetical protein